MEDKTERLRQELLATRKIVEAARELIDNLDRDLYDTAVKQVKGEK